MKRRSIPKQKTIGSYSKKRKNPKSMMYGPTSHAKTHNKTLSDSILPKQI